MNKPRLVLAGRKDLIDSFESQLAHEYQIVGRVSDGRALIDAIRRERPSIVVLDMSLPLLTGLEVARQVRRFDRAVKFVFIASSEEPETAADAFRAGGLGYLLTRSTGTELLPAIRDVLQGRTYVTPLVTEGMLASLTRQRESSEPAGEITVRQREVLRLLAAGKSMKEVATVLNITPRTVAFHKYRLMEQLKIQSNAQLIQYAIRHQLV